MFFSMFSNKVLKYSSRTSAGFYIQLFVNPFNQMNPSEESLYPKPCSGCIRNCIHSVLVQITVQEKGIAFPPILISRGACSLSASYCKCNPCNICILHNITQINNKRHAVRKEPTRYQKVRLCINRSLYVHQQAARGRDIFTIA